MVTPIAVEGTIHRQGRHSVPRQSTSFAVGCSTEARRPSVKDAPRIFLQAATRALVRQEALLSIRQSRDFLWFKDLP